MNMTNRILAALLIILAQVTVSLAVERQPASRTAVILDATDGSSRRGSVGIAANGLATAMANYCNYLLHDRGVAFEIFDASGDSVSMVRAQQLLDAGFERVISLKARGRYQTRTVDWIDHRRFHHRRRVPGFVTLEIEYDYFVGRNRETAGVHHGHTKKQALRNWQALPKSLRSRTADSIVVFNPEPLGFVIERALTDVFRRVAPAGTKDLNDRSGLPVRVLLDSASFPGPQSDRQERISRMIDVASRAMRRQFGRGLYLIGIELRSGLIDTSLSFQRAYRRLLNTLPPAGDTFLVVLTSHASRVGLVPAEEREAIGRSELGRRLILLDTTPFPHPRSPSWQTFENGLNLLHEIGHSLGAIHVADFSSIMNPSSNWMASDQFDRLNHSIIQAVLEGQLDPTDPVAYLKTLSRQLSVVNYHLSDYPTFLYEFLHRRDHRLMVDTLRAAVNRPSYLAAADGYGWLLKGYISKAADLFREAIQADPNQASLYFLLSQAASGEEAEEALRKAADMGYAEAQRRVGARLAGQ